MSLLGISVRPSSSLILNPKCGPRACTKSTKMLWCPEDTYVPSQYQDRRRTPDYSSRRGFRSRKSLEDVFISALVTASSCPEHAPRKTATFLTRHRRHFTSRATRLEAASPQIVRAVDLLENGSVTQEEAKDLVNIYDNPKFLVNHPLRRQRLAPRLFMTMEQEERVYNTPRQVAPPQDDEHRQQLERFGRKLQKRSPGWLDHRKIWESWRALPAPRVRYLPDEIIRRLLSHLTTIEFKNAPGAMKRYMEVFEECFDERVPVTLGEWNSAISFAGRWVRDISTSEVKNAVEMWMRMEDHGIRASNVTFNILFDIAVKAGRYALADTIFAELKARGMELSRFFRTTMIYYAGARGDGDAVRNAFNEFVEAGEIVDTSVMNCVMLSLIRSGEGAAAEHVFAKMKDLHATKFGTAGSNSWQHQRELGRILDTTARQLRREKERHQDSFFGGVFSQNDKRDQIQKASPIAPNERTYRILINHHIHDTGELTRIQELLIEMRSNGLRIHGGMYVSIMRGFEEHGGFAFSEWSHTLLEAVWAELSVAMQRRMPGSKDEGVLLERDPFQPLEEKSTGRDTVQESQHAANGIDDIDRDFYSHFDPTDGGGDDLVDDIHEDAQGRSLETNIPSTTRSDSSGVETTDDDAAQEVEDLFESEEGRRPYFTRALAKAALRSFYKCVGLKRMLEVWEQIQKEWPDMPHEDRADLLKSVEWMKARD
ncbi:hypothetical protein K431DRAFT_287818 [Polychaeton citri CBS 116435]|uniref:Pentatricopeptide repeat protein n=1 Tax=Polychaeton citri CBS 116435 TaxID=1314669 RepID=A0A9P4Q4I1_9PEZI|nr:hypothetical protein K431DRAFT_287818 [Polychaeton citri CBS 116435]